MKYYNTVSKKKVRFLGNLAAAICKIPIETLKTQSFITINDKITLKSHEGHAFNNII